MGRVHHAELQIKPERGSSGFFSHGIVKSFEPAIARQWQWIVPCHTIVWQLAGIRQAPHKPCAHCKLQTASPHPLKALHLPQVTSRKVGGSRGLGCA